MVSVSLSVWVTGEGESGPRPSEEALQFRPGIARPYQE